MDRSILRFRKPAAEPVARVMLRPRRWTPPAQETGDIFGKLLGLLQARLATRPDPFVARLQRLR